MVTLDQRMHVVRCRGMSSLRGVEEGRAATDRNYTPEYICYTRCEKNERVQTISSAAVTFFISVCVVLSRTCLQPMVTAASVK